MDHNRGVLARFDHFVEITDTAFTYRTGQRPILPPGAVGADQVATDQVRGAQVVVAGHAVQRQSQAVRHVLHEARLAAPGRPLEQHRQAMLPGLLEDLHLVTHGHIERSCARPAIRRPTHALLQHCPAFRRQAIRTWFEGTTCTQDKLDCDQAAYPSAVLMIISRLESREFRRSQTSTARGATRETPKEKHHAIRQAIRRDTDCLADSDGAGGSPCE
ncbi:hypothetical protein D3C78_1020490 [compost metagenome]